MNKTINIDTSIEFLNENYANASISLNPNFQWAKIVVTDDMPNGNKQKIPLDEFDNLIKTGINSPIKMARNKISLDHKEAFGNPIGVITQLTKEGNKLIALSALWKKERSEDVAALKELYVNGTPPQTSWEISYEISEVDPEGVEVLKNTSLNGLAIVGLPAYEGRTPFIAMSSKNTEELTVEEIEKVKLELEAVKKDFNDAKSNFEQKNKELEDLNKELTTLREYKASIEEKENQIKKLNDIKNRFKEAGLEKDENYFEKNKETLLSFDETKLDFMVQEMVAFSAKPKETLSSIKPKVPKINNPDTSEFDLDNPLDLGKALREAKLAKTINGE